MSGNTKPEATESPEKTQRSRKDIRDKIFAAKPETRTVEFFGETIELRQPTLGVIIEQRANDNREAAVQLLMNYSFVPGTNDRVFEAADEEAIRSLPFGADMQRLMREVNLLLGVDVEGLEKQVLDAMKSPEGGAPTNLVDVSGSRTGEE